MDYSNFKDLKAFFKALMEGHFRKSTETSATTIINGQRTPVNKAHSLELLRKIPALHDMDDDALIKYLLNPVNLNRVLGSFSLNQQTELQETLKPVAAEEVGIQQSEGQAAEADQQNQPQAAGSTGPGLPSLPTSSSSYQPRVIHNIPRTPEKPVETIAVTNKSGKIIEERPTGGGKLPAKETPKIAIANKSGVIIGEHPVKNLTSNFGSRVQVGLKRLGTRLGSAATSGLGGAIGGGGRFLGRVGMGGVNAFGRLSNEVTRGKSFAGKAAKKRWVLLLFGGIFMFTVLIGTIGAGPNPGGITPPPGPPGPPIVGVAASCPVQNGKIITSSYHKSPTYGHCSAGYTKEFTCTQCPGGPDQSRRADAIDVETGGPSGKDVTLPVVSGQTVSWKLLTPICAGAGKYPDCTASNGGTGALLNFEGTGSGSSDKWYIQFVHIYIPSISVKVGESYPPGTVVAKTDSTNHVHTTLGKNIADPNAGCDPGWMPSDFMCDGSIPAAISADSFSIGNGSRGTSITGYKIGNGSSAGVAIIGSIHGKWEDAARQLVEAAKDALANKSISLPSNLTVYLVPVINVDPLTTNTSDGKAAFNANSVDLNRNFDSSSVPNGAWSNLTCALGKYQALGASAYSCEGLGGTIDASSTFSQFCSNPSRVRNQIFYCAEGFSGSGPLSESESQSLAGFLTGNNIKVVLSYHAPLSDVAISNGGQRITGAVELARLVASATGLTYHDYWPYYPLTGQLMDWLQDKGTIGVEVELPGPAVSLSNKERQLGAIGQALNWTSNKFK